MLTNQLVHQKLMEMYNEPNIIFELTGSRFFGGERKDSDWDYFTEDTPETRLWLQYRDFHVESESYKDDPQITTVYRFKDGGFQIDVQLVENIHKKRLVQSILNRSGLIRYIASQESNDDNMRKFIARKLWTAMYRLLDEIK